MFSGIRGNGTTGIRRVTLVQAGLAPIAAMLGGAFGGLAAGLAVLYGALVAMAVSGILMLREQQSMRHPEWDQHRLFKLFIRAGIERLLVLVGLLGLGLWTFRLAPLPLLVGLILAQFAWLAAAMGRGKKR